MREAFFFCVLAVLLLAVSSPAYSVIILEDGDYQTLLKIIGDSRQECLSLKLILKTYQQELEALRLELLQLSQDLVIAQKGLEGLQIILDEQKQSLEQARFWNDAWPWIAGGALILGVAGGIWLGHSLK